MVSSDPNEKESGVQPETLKFLFNSNRDQIPSKPYFEDANSEFYSKESRKARRNLSKKLEVKDCINQFIEANFQLSGPSRERVVSKDEYIITFTKICDILYSGENARDPAEIE